MKKTRFVALALATSALGIGAFIGGQDLFAQTPPAPATSPTTTPTTGPAAAAELRGIYDSFEKNLKALPRDRFEVAAVTEIAGRDADSLVAWVRDQTDPLPYRGALKGSTGVLMDRAGNSLDRALLLAELLQSAGYEARLANATLQPAQAEQVSKLTTSVRRHAGNVTDIPEAEAARQRAQKQTDRLLSAIGTTPPANANEQAATLAAISDHWWVQRQQAGKWIDLDLYGLSNVPAARTLPLKPNPAELPLDAKDCHTVELRVVVEVLRGGKLTTEPVLKQTFRTAEALGRTINFRHIVGNPMPDADMEDEPVARKRLRDRLVAQEIFLPVLLVDDRQITEASFSTDGTIDRNPQMNPAGKLAAKVGEVFGGLGGGGDEDSPKGILTAEFIEYDIRVPGQAVKTIRRPVFDLIGPAARQAGVAKAPALDDQVKLGRALAMLGQTQIMLQACDLSPMYILYQQARAELRDKQIWISVTEGGRNTDAQIQRGLERINLRDTTTPLFAVMRRAIGAAPATIYVDQPNIIHHRSLIEATANGGMARRRGMDLAYTSTAALGSAAEAYNVRIKQGVADTLAEHLALGEEAAASENTVGVFEATPAAAPAVVRPAETAALQKLNLPADVTARAKVDTDSGNILVLASGAPGRWSWWRVNAATGQTVGVMDSGYNQSLTEQEAQYEKQLFGFNTRLKPPMKAKDFLKMSKDEIKEWGKDPNTVTNLIGLQADWKMVILKRGIAAMRIVG